MALKPDNQVQIRIPIRVKSSLIFVNLDEDAMKFEYMGIKDALTLTFRRTIRVPDNKRDINMLPPDLGQFPIFLVQVSLSCLKPIAYIVVLQITNSMQLSPTNANQDYAQQLPVEVAEKSGVFFTMYQREAMWINFEARLPFAIRIFVGGINAVSGLPMEAGEVGVRKKIAKVQDYMVVPGQPWLDGIVCADGEVRQFVAQHKDSGFSVESQLNGKDTIGGIQVEVIPIKCEPPKRMEVHYEDLGRGKRNREIDLEKNGIGPSSTWKDLKVVLERELGIPIGKQVLYPHVEWNYYLPIDDDVEISKYYFKEMHKWALPCPCKLLGFQRTSPYADIADPSVLNKPGFVLGVSRNHYDAVPPPKGLAGSMADYSRSGMPASYDGITNRIGQMSMAAGGLIKQTIVPDRNPADVWDKNAAIQFHIHILDTATFAAVTKRSVPEPPISAQTYAEHDSPFFSIWGEEPTGIVGSFANVRSIAELEEARAKAEGKQYEEEESVPQRVSVIGDFESTFRPVGPR
ncbi:hypothetical protein GQX73_g9313 [Xylaria multiplex]|uniref:Uncharacterized protein n=1 Tax=Xylaria multiplex TaxID=323545 RepID=A0A7C8IQX2_9PEZI|nr:hypothetical protein GQX73_g9313 [Xylaria multiplex]